ncbi:hypothetical protein L1987_89723 [Smallanthus sonchifolius]|nr:hypothetical protein L1987_89723 [Smallanthus sonchifolius]
MTAWQISFGLDGQKWPLKGKKQMTLAVIYYRLIRRRLKFLRMEHHVIGLLFLSFSLSAPVLLRKSSTLMSDGHRGVQNTKKPLRMRGDCRWVAESPPFSIDIATEGGIADSRIDQRALTGSRSTPQVDTVGVADPIETKTKPEADPDAYLGRLSGRAAPSSEVPEGQLGEQGQERKKVEEGGRRWTWMLEKAVSSLAPMLGESVNGKLLAISEAQESRRKKAHQKEGGPRNDCLVGKERFSRQIEKEGPIEKNVEMRVAFSSAGASSK